MAFWTTSKPIIWLISILLLNHNSSFSRSSKILAFSRLWSYLQYSVQNLFLILKNNLWATNIYSANRHPLLASTTTLTTTIHYKLVWYLKRYILQGSWRRLFFNLRISSQESGPGRAYRNLFPPHSLRTSVCRVRPRICGGRREVRVPGHFSWRGAVLERVVLALPKNLQSSRF